MMYLGIELGGTAGRRSAVVRWGPFGGRGTAFRFGAGLGGEVLRFGLFGTDLHHLAIAPNGERNAEALVLLDHLTHRIAQGLEGFFAHEAPEIIIGLVHLAHDLSPVSALLGDEQ